MTTFAFFLVGGIVRDMLLGVASKDHDFAVVITDLGPREDPFLALGDHLLRMGARIHVETPEFLTIRAGFGKHGMPGFPEARDADFVIARKDSAGSDGRRPDFVTLGTLADDLDRRDFTMNALALAADGTVIDRHNGQQDLADGLIRFVGDPMVRIREDALRVMRALRFSVTKGFRMAPATLRAIHDPEVPALLAAISAERRSDELNRMLQHDTLATLDLLGHTITAAGPGLQEAIFSGPVRLMSTLKQ